MFYLKYGSYKLTGSKKKFNEHVTNPSDIQLGSVTAALWDE